MSADPDPQTKTPEKKRGDKYYMRKTKKSLAILAIVAMVLTMLPVSAFAATGAASNRFAGSDRYATAAAIAKQAYPNGTNTAILTSGNDDNLVDALTAAPLAAKLNAPILLTENGKLTQATADALQQLGVKNIYVTSGAIAPVVSALSAYNVTKVYGDNRFETAIAIANQVNAAPTAIFVARADVYADALSAASIAAAKGMPVLLTPTDQADASVKTYLAQHTTIANSYVLGSTAAVSDSAAAAFPNVTRLGGSNRWETNMAILKQFSSSLQYNTVYVANGTDAHVVDALAGSVLAAKTNSPIALTDTAAMDTASAAYVNSQLTAGSVVDAFGDTSVVPDSVVNGLQAAQIGVTSVSAINGQQLLVKFNQAVDPVSAANPLNYSLTGTATYSVTSPTVQADNRSVVLTLNPAVPKATSATFGITVNGVALASDKTQKFPIYTTLVTVSDTTAPTVTGVNSITAGATASSITVNFSEPVVSGSIVIDGGATSYGVTLGQSTTLTGLTLDASKSHSIEVVNLQDASGNNNTYQNFTFGITKDTAAPVITAVSAQGDSAILVTFSKKMGTVLSNAVDVKDETYTSLGGSIAPLGVDTTGTKYVVSFNTTGLYATTNTRNLTLVFNGTGSADYLGNAFASVIKTVTLTKDTTAPVVTGVTVQKDATGTPLSFTLQFSEAIGLGAGSPTVVDQNGVLQSTAITGSALGGDGASIVYTVTGLTGKISVSAPAGLAKDTALVANNSAAYNGVVDLGTPTAAAGTFTVSGVTAVTGQTITVTFGKAVKGGAVAGSATDLANYSLAGKGLPAGTVITLNAGVPAQTTATIQLPAGSIAADSTAAIFRVNNVVALDGSTLTPYLNYVNVYDNTAPVLQSAKIVNNTTVILTFNGAMAPNGTAVTGDFSFMNGGLSFTPGTVTASSVAGYPNQVQLTLNQFDVTKSLSISTVAAPSALKDASAIGNVIAGGITVTAQ